MQGADSGSDLAQGSTFAEKQLVSYSQVATSPLVLDRVITQLGLDLTTENLADRVVATATTDTVILEISVTDPNAERAARIANSIGQQLASVASDLSPEPPDGSQSVRATILAPAQLPLAPSSPKIIRNLVGRTGTGPAAGHRYRGTPTRDGYQGPN